MDHRRDRYRYDLLARAESIVLDFLGKANARFPEAGASSSWSGEAQPSLGKYRCALMNLAQRRVGEHCDGRTISPNSWSLGSLPGD